MIVCADAYTALFFFEAREAMSPSDPSRPKFDGAASRRPSGVQPAVAPTYSGRRLVTHKGRRSQVQTGPPYTARAELSPSRASATGFLELDQAATLNRSRTSRIMFKGRSVMRLSSQLRGARLGLGDVLCLLLLLVLPITCSALEMRSVQTCSGIVLRLRGDINVGDYSRLKARFNGKEPIVGFDLSSEGGDLEEGLRIADLVRRKALTVYVAGKCNSACADVFLAAASRHFGAGTKIGVHAVSNDRDVEDVRSKLLTIELARLWAKHGVPNSAIAKMVTTRPETITYLDQADLSGLEASEGNPFAYKAEKSSEAEQGPQQSCATQLHARKRHET